MFGLDVLTVGSYLILASNSFRCSVPEPPQININPVTQDIRYNFDHSRENLDRYRAHVEGKPMEVDSSTGGLRYDQPKINTRMEWGIRTDKRADVSCMWYSQINVDIELSPLIYIASDYKTPTCRDEIMRHEEMHVQIDREVINKYARRMGADLQNMLRQTGAVGPFASDRLKEMEGKLSRRVENVLQTQIRQLKAELDTRQAQIDTPAEYKRISLICHAAERRGNGG